MPQEDDRVVIGGMDHVTLSGGNYYMAENTTNLEGDKGPISPIVEVVFSPNIWWEKKKENGSVS